MSLYSALARPALFALDAERAHDLTMSALRLAITPSLLSLTRRQDEPQLEQRTLGLAFRNPIGLAAGLDKQGTAVAAWSAMGFGFAEIGTVTPRPQPGNPRPRLFRLRDDHAIINRFGFNSDGAEAVAANLSRSGGRQATAPLRVGINVGKNKDTPNERAVDDYVTVVDVLHPFADYFVINVSSPNTVGLRALQDREALGPLVEQVVMRVRRIGRDVPVLVKVSPDLREDDLLASVDAAVSAGAGGVVATNTTIERTGLSSSPDLTQQAGGLSGMPLLDRAAHTCKVLYRHLSGRIPIVGVGGIFTADDAYRRIRCGAALVQLYTGLIYEGPAVVSQIAAGIAERLRRDGFSSVAEAVGIDAD